ncbi:hypothetical protein GF373_04345 [bacterium]|nr:hypothetical protein [bacterium]
MVTLDELNLLRQHEKWDEVLTKSRDHIKDEPTCSYALRALVQALEKQNKKDEEYESALLQLLDIQDRVIDTATKLAQFYRDQGHKAEAVKYYEKAIHTAADERQYDHIEEAWQDLVELAPERISFFIKITDRLHTIKHHQKAASLLQKALPSTQEREDWDGRYRLLRKIMEYTPQDANLREQFIDTLTNKYEGSKYFDDILNFSGIKKDRNLEEALRDVDTFSQFMPDSFVQHSDWGIGRVKDLNMQRKRVTINFQRKRNHQMDIHLAKDIVDRLPDDDYRVMLVTNKEELQRMVKEEPLKLVKNVLKSFNGSLTAKEIKEKLYGKTVQERDWSSWWSKVTADVRKDPYISVTGGALKQYTIQEEATSDEEEFLARFDSTKVPRDKVDMVYEYLRTTKKAEINEDVIKHFSKRIQAMVPKRKSPVEKVELWYANEDLKAYSDSVESMPEDILEETLLDMQKAIMVLKRLRFRQHELRYIERFQQFHPEGWVDSFQQKLLEEDIQVRNEIAEYLVQHDRMDVLNSVIDTTLSDYRKYPQTFIWLARKTLLGEANWLKGRLSNAALLERLLILTDYLTSQAKRREKDEAVWLRKVAGEAREIIRRNHYSLFKEHIQGADESLAQAIYRRSQTNEGLDGRTSADLTTFIRGRFPTLFETKEEEETLVPEGLQCLKESLEEKQTLLKRLIEKELPAVVKEIEIARGHGDLKENAEYHAAKDKQRLLSSQTAELQEQLEQARVVDVNEVETDKIQFGTHFTVSPIGSDRNEDYIMLGPWESDPDRKILSYLAPFAAFFLGHSAGEEVDVELPRHTGRYEVISIDRLSESKVQEIVNRIQKQDESAIQSTQNTVSSAGDRPTVEGTEASTSPPESVEETVSTGSSRTE